MDINRNSTSWRADIERSVDFYNKWFLDFAPATYREKRKLAAMRVSKAFAATSNGKNISKESFRKCPGLLPILRQMTCPPLARDRLAGLAKVSRTTVKHFEDGGQETRVSKLEPILKVIARLLDVDLMPWLSDASNPKPASLRRAALVVADRLCGALSDPIIRNAQERRQLAAIATFLRSKGYHRTTPTHFNQMKPGEYAFHLNIKATHGADKDKGVNIPVDVAILPKSSTAGSLPIIIEAKSAGDFANVNKRRKEEVTKLKQLQATYGDVRFLLFLCGYFDAGYLGYEAYDGFDWIWEHRISDMEKLGL